MHNLVQSLLFKSCKNFSRLEQLSSVCIQINLGFIKLKKNLITSKNSHPLCSRNVFAETDDGK